MNRTIFCVAALAVVASTSEAHAYDLLTKSGDCPNGFVWTSDQQVGINSTFTGVDSFAITGAMIDVAERINNAGGQWFDYVQPYTVTSGGYVRGFPDNINLNGYNEVGMTNMAGTGASGSGGAYVNRATCEIIETDVFFDTNTNWVFGAPEDYGDAYYAAGSNVVVSGTSERYGRTVMLHEMLHTLSLAHSNSSYSFMNQTNRPWSNRAREKRVEPLPDDREALRFLYPNGATEIDGGALVTWYSVNASPPATGTLLCRPSGGTAFSPGIFDNTCGVDGAADGSTTLCPGDMLYVRAAAVNYGTTSLTFDPQLWFSLNDWLNTTAGADVQSPTVRASFTLGGSSSSRRGWSFQIPTSLSYDTDYYPILFLDSGASYASEESQQNNWIPLIAPIHIDSASNCP